MNVKSLASILTLAAAACGFTAGCAKQAHGDPVAIRPSLTVFPIEMAGQAREDVARLVALSMEQRGMESIEVVDEVFAPGADTPFEDRVSAFSEFVRMRDLATEYALYGAVLGSPRTGVDEIQSVLVASDGTVAWTDRQTRNDRAFRRAKPRDPMSSTMFLVERLRGPLALQKPDRSAAKGRWARAWESDSLAPSDAERGDMESRLASLRDARSTPTVLVYPARAGDAWSLECADRLAAEINRSGLFVATAADAEMAFEVEPSHNQQKVLWSGARSIRETVRQRPPVTDYVLLADYMMSRSGEAGAVHTFLLESDGDWVIVDYQNSHHDDFNAIAPRSLGDCCDLSVKRLGGYLGRT